MARPRSPLHKLRHRVKPKEVVSESEPSERKEIPLKCKEWAGGAALARVKQKHVPAVGHGEECTSKSYRTHLGTPTARSYKAWVGHSKQAGPGIDETNR